MNGRRNIFTLIQGLCQQDGSIQQLGVTEHIHGHLLSEQFHHFSLSDDSSTHFCLGLTDSTFAINYVKCSCSIFMTVSLLSVHV